METIFIQLGKDELAKIIHEAVRAALPKELKESNPEPFIKGIHELAEFLKVSPSRAQKLKNEGAFPYWQDGRTLLFEPNKVKEAMQNLKAGKGKRNG